MKIKAIVLVFCILLTQVLIMNFFVIRIKMKAGYAKKQKEASVLIDKFILEDMKCFPIPIAERGHVSLENDYGTYRDNGGHEGCDILYDKDVPGMIPIVSATDGTITNLGWLYLGGYRIGISSTNDIYYYYAHFDTFAPGLFVGKEIKAGEFLGFMGNSGEGQEGTKGKFPVHLHFGIYIQDENGKEKSVNPYQYLLENK